MNDGGPFGKLDSKLALATAHRICATYLIVTTELQKVHGAECFKSFCRIASRFRFTIQRYRSADSSDILISFMLLAEFDETSRQLGFSAKPCESIVAWELRVLPRSHLQFRNHREMTKLLNKGGQLFEKKLLIVCQLKLIRSISRLPKRIAPANPVLSGPVCFLNSRLCIEPLTTKSPPAIRLSSSFDFIKYVRSATAAGVWPMMVTKV